MIWMGNTLMRKIQKIGGKYKSYEDISKHGKRHDPYDQGSWKFRKDCGNLSQNSTNWPSNCNLCACLTKIQKQVKKLREATYTAAVCKFPALQQILSLTWMVSTIFWLRGAHRPRPQ